MIDAIIKIVAGVFVSNAGKMNDGVALVQQGLPVEQPREIRKRNGGYVRIVEGGRHSRCSDHAVALSNKIRNQMTSDKPVGAGDEHPGFLAVAAILRARRGARPGIGSVASRYGT